MKKKGLCLALVAMLLFTQSGAVVYAESINASQEAINNIEKITGTSEINADIYEIEEDKIIVDGTDAIIEIPYDADEELTIDDGEDRKVSMNLPAEVMDTEGILSDDGTVLYNCDESLSIGVQAIKEESDIASEGVRTLINIENNSAPKEYSFEYDLNEGERLVSSKELLGDDYDTGEVFVVDAKNNILNIIDAPWAEDANGNNIETYYKIDGQTLTQVIEFNEDTAFLVVADPSFWQVTKCAGTILWVIGTTIFTAAKIVKLKKAIKAAGGVRKAAKGIIVAIKASRGLGGKWWTKIKWSQFGSGLAGFGADLIGISDIRSNCSF